MSNRLLKEPTVSFGLMAGDLTLRRCNDRAGKSDIQLSPVETPVKAIESRLSHRADHPQLAAQREAMPEGTRPVFAENSHPSSRTQDSPTPKKAPAQRPGLIKLYEVEPKAVSP
ncbi:hypothetical protein [Aestuariibius insulae]|uniref:hypothetical protein n=1 Tax=Aestuariibius insulae TaxID=2058287 RepID=UPI00398E91C5